LMLRCDVSVQSYVVKHACVSAKIYPSQVYTQLLINNMNY